MFVPNSVEAFGSAYAEVEDLGRGWNFYVTRTHLKSLDRPTQRCEEDTRQRNAEP